VPPQLPRIRQVVLAARDLTEIRISAPHDRFELAGVRFQPVASQVKARRCESC
jgi:hypothetical protein